MRYHSAIRNYICKGDLMTLENVIYTSLKINNNQYCILCNYICRQKNNHREYTKMLTAGILSMSFIFFFLPPVVKFSLSMVFVWFPDSGTIHGM